MTAEVLNSVFWIVLVVAITILGIAILTQDVILQLKGKCQKQKQQEQLNFWKEETKTTWTVK